MFILYPRVNPPGIFLTSKAAGFSDPSFKSREVGMSDKCFFCPLLQ